MSEIEAAHQGVGQQLQGRLVGQPLRRVEDARLLAGLGRYVDDHQGDKPWHLAIRRSDQAHARIVGVRTDAARVMPGVRGVFVWDDIRAAVKPATACSRMTNYQPTSIHALADGVARYVGEPVVAVVADDRYLAEDALEAIEIDYQPLPAAHDPEAALRDDAPRLHATLASNVLVERAFTRGDVQAAFAQAAAVVGGCFRFHRKSPVAMESRCYLARIDVGRDALTLVASTQVPGVIRDAISELLGLPGTRLQVIAPDVGGGFGGKTPLYPEELLVCVLARRLGHAVKWTGDRLEDLLSTTQAFDQKVEAELAVDAEGRILGLRAEVLSDIGAYSIYPWTAGIEPVQVLSFLPGPYRVPCFQGRVRALATPKAPTGPYRGVGRPTSTFAMERLVDLAAARLGLDPIEMRRRNLVRDDEFPYRTPAGIVWDRCAFVGTLEAAAQRFDMAAARAAQARARAEGRWVGIGVASYAELTGIGSRISSSPGMPINTGTDTCVLQLDSTGSVHASFGCASHGQGHETALAQVLADELGASFDDIRVTTGSTATVPHGTGSYASRSAVISGGAAIVAARDLRERMRQMAAHLLGCTPEQLQADASRFTVAGTGPGLSFRELAAAVYAQMGRIPPELREDLMVTRMYDPVIGSTSAGNHIAEVEVDPRTCAVHVRRYLIAEDCGRVINPLIVEGQTRGALAQGIGAALFEEVVYDGDGQLLTATLADYLLPSAPELPELELIHVPTLAANNVGGFRGAGEGGAIGAPAAIANAVADALAPLGIAMHELPITPQRIFDALHASGHIDTGGHSGHRGHSEET